MKTDPRHIRIEDYDYPLPDERIAKFPLTQRDSSKLLIYRHGQLSDSLFHHLPEELPKGALVVMNNTRVIRARLHFQKVTGAQIEVFLLEPHQPVDYQVNFSTRGSVVWQCMVGNLKRWKSEPLQGQLGKVVLTAERVGEDSPSLGPQPAVLVRFSWDDASLTFSEILELAGELPIPPYLHRATEASDLVTYQTVYSKVEGSVAAPTAGLHFTPRVLSALDDYGFEREEVTLHVGAGTFRPVKSEEIGDHEMHSEHIYVPRKTIEALIRHGGKAVAVGTTSVRTLESLYYIGRKVGDVMNEEDLTVSQWEPYEVANEEEEGEHTVEYLHNLLDYLDHHQLDALRTSTRIIIAPGYRYHIVQAMVTNFHQPQSTLLLLVSAFIGEEWRCLYRHALAHDYRFLSYGDACLLIP